MPVSPTLTAGQLRVLRFCAGWPHWLSRLELSLALVFADVSMVPSLVERGLLELTVRATEAGGGGSLIARYY
jgi:hypothetical protein